MNKNVDLMNTSYLHDESITKGITTSFQTQIVDSVVKSDNGGLRYDEGKPRYDLIPPEAIEAIAIHYMQGAKKYADRNWERGMNWGKCFRALMSHAIKWQKGETYDNDPSMPDYEAHHMIAVAWNAIALYIYQTRGIGVDDRVIVKKD